MVMLGLVRTIGAERSARRLIRAVWEDLAKRANSRRLPDTSAWISQMLGRVGLLTPRLIAIGQDPSSPLLGVLADTRAGIAIDDLQRLLPSVAGRDAIIVKCVLRSVGRHFAGLRGKGGGAVTPSLARNTDEPFGASPVSTIGPPVARWFSLSRAFAASSRPPRRPRILKEHRRSSVGASRPAPRT